jgi:CheY-like chemotaxis protein
MVGLRARGKGLRLICETHGIVAAVRGDEGKLRQILVNLLGNAVKFTLEGSVVLRARWQDGRGTFEIEDSGPGLTAEESAKLFGAFVQARSGEESKEGTGLGLAISRNYARLMGGDLTFTSAPGRGSIFRCEIDLPQAEATAVPDDRRRVVSLAAGQRPPRAIVADDSRANRLLLSRLLARVGMSVREASNGREALELWESEPADILLLDLRMPELGGREVVEILRSKEAGGRRVPIVAVTASAFESERDDLVAAGFDDMILKPFRENEIFRIFTRLLETRFEWEEETSVAAARPFNASSFDGFEPEWIARFRKALVDGDLDEALKLAAEIERRDPELARDVHQRLRSFRFDEIDAALGGSGSA